jgi:TIR domain
VVWDVFVSYRHQQPDGPWVREVLVERLRAAGLRVLEMARGVEESRYTLAVLSPAYLAGNFTELESVLAEHLGLEASERRLLAVMREPCRPRLGIRARLWLDMTSDEEVDRNLPRLVEELRAPPGVVA